MIVNKGSSGNSILPNTFQHPNVFIDRLMAYLTPQENTVLTYAVRAILGWQENISTRTDHISISQFTDGYRSKKDNRPLSNGCGMCIESVRKALAALAQYRILIPTTPKPDLKEGQEYWLQEDELAIDWDGLEERREQSRDKSKRRVSKARNMRSVRQNGSVLSDRTLPFCRTETPETHIKPILNPESAFSEKNPENPVNPVISEHSPIKEKAVTPFLPMSVKAEETSVVGEKGVLARRTDAVVKGNALDGMVAYAAAAGARSEKDKINQYPQDVQAALVWFYDLWHLPVPVKPRKGGGEYAEWITELRDLINIAGQHGKAAFTATHRAWNENPFTVGRPGALRVTMRAAVGRMYKSAPAVILQENIPAPAFVPNTMARPATLLPGGK